MLSLDAASAFPLSVNRVLLPVRCLAVSAQARAATGHDHPEIGKIRKSP